MVTFRLEYNPYLIQTKVWLKVGSAWIPLSEESGLTRITKMRMQRWLSPYGENYAGERFFHELRAASGEDIMEIFFSGTAENLKDLSDAAQSYMQKNKTVHISIMPYGEKHNGRRMEKAFEELIKKAKSSVYSLLIPEYIWDFLEKRFSPIKSVGMFVVLEDWNEKRKEIFEIGAWKMICLIVPYHKLSEYSIQEAMRSFAEQFQSLADRDLERERFIIICSCEKGIFSDFIYVKDMVKKKLLEYGLHDLNFFLLEEQEVALLDEENIESGSASLLEARKAICLYCNTYAKESRIRKTYDGLQELLQKEGFVKGGALFRKIEYLLREEHVLYSKAAYLGKIDDKEVYSAYQWTVELLEELEELLEEM